MKNFIRVVGIAVLVSMAMAVFAESAPVYDADDMSQMDAEFEQQNQAAADVPPPPPSTRGNFCAYAITRAH